MIEQRIEHYRRIEGLRKRPLIVYATSTRPNIKSVIAADAIRDIIDQIDAIPVRSTAVDILLHSFGGDPLTAWKIMSLLRGRFSTVGVLVPFSAFSAATLMALGADEIVMHGHASLGPIDPQIEVRNADGKSIAFGYEDVGAFLRFIHKQAGLTDQAHVSTIIDKLFQTVNPLAIGAARRASDLSGDMGERLLSMHMPDRSRARQIAEALNSSFFNHGDAISKKRAKDIGLAVSDDNLELERLMWSAFESIEQYMELRKPFNHMETFLADQEAAASLLVPAPLRLPSDTPPDLANQIWNQVAQNALSTAQGNAKTVSYAIINAIIESARTASENKTQGEVTAVRVGPAIQLSVAERTTGWVRVTIPSSSPGSTQVSRSEGRAPVPALVGASPRRRRKKAASE